MNGRHVCQISVKALSLACCCEDEADAEAALGLAVLVLIAEACGGHGMWLRIKWPACLGNAGG
tara:strand:+ start:3327 stop:3515 length:189 start_codon:yes stop_codon:yes gene_type:complete